MRQPTRRVCLGPPIPPSRPAGPSVCCRLDSSTGGSAVHDGVTRWARCVARASALSPRADARRASTSASTLKW
eukprot:1709463-Prymnesium_polylepis.2